MKQLKKTTINKYNVLQLCKHLQRYQLENDIFLFRFDFQYQGIYKVEKVKSPLGYSWNSFYFYCHINDLYREEICEVLASIYSQSVNF